MHEQLSQLYTSKSIYTLSCNSTPSAAFLQEPTGSQATHPSALIGSRKQLPLLLLLLASLFFACKKGDLPPAPAPEPQPQPPITQPDLTTPLKNEADFPIGVAISYAGMMNDTRYQDIVKRDFDAVTFEYNMKHGAIVNAGGGKDYSRADEMVDKVTAAGLSVFGHTLIWHQNNNGDFLRSFGTSVVAGGSNLMLTPADLNGTFENAGSGTTPATLFQGWFGSTGGNAAATFEKETANPQQGSAALKVSVATPGANPWDVQFLNSDWKPTAGKTYQIKFWVKSAGSGSFRAINQTPNAGSPHFAQMTVTPTATWSEVVWNYTAPAGAIQFGFHFPSAGTFWIDAISIQETTLTPVSNAVGAQRMDSVMKDWIQTTVNRYKSKVRAWDVVNEPFTDGNPVLRNGSNSTGDTYYWAQFLGRGYIAKAFRYAREVDATAELYLNDYNLESNPAKLDSIIALANELKAAGVPITGIGTQMHVTLNDSYANIDQMLRKLAATGLKVRISELDVRADNSTAAQASLAAMYKHVASSYIKNVPAAQRAGITVWGVTDTSSWLYNNGTQFPLLYDKDYNRKPAYGSFLTGLREK
ncbi:MAG TPA: endo-1,4-beta-xylanase [Flavisolibacter sp.]|jgi:endo-1,4-beta-xylanase|nr:endo-1,4-beta-xylanase [Flavisolibacter sp.]